MNWYLYHTQIIAANKIRWWGQGNHLAFESQGVQKVLGSIPCICPGKRHCNLKCYLITHNFLIAWSIHFFFKCRNKKARFFFLSFKEHITEICISAEKQLNL